MDFNKDTVLIIYKGNSRSDKEGYGYASALKPHVHDIDVTKEPLTSTQIKEIADKLGVEVEALVDKESDVYKEEYTGMSFDASNWLNILSQKPALLRTPIIFDGEDGHIFESGRDVIKYGTTQKGI
jgi:arsenate reductase-like glutaredoxin family protein